MNTQRNRVPGGTYGGTGGQFTTTARAESSVNLTPTPASTGLYAQRFGKTLDELRASHHVLEQHAAELAREKQQLLQQLANVEEATLINQADLASVASRIEVYKSWNAPQYAKPSPTPYLDPTYVDSVVELADGTVMHKYDEDQHLVDVNRVRVQLDRELTEDEARQLASLAGYGWSKLGGERSYGFEQDRPNSVVLQVDSTKVRGDVHRFANELLDGDLIRQGSPIRTTDRTGARGTRAVEGLGHADTITVYFDS